MHIAFKFQYIHDNGLFTRLLCRIQELSSIPVSISKDGMDYKIEASGDQETLEGLAEQISTLIPQSLFLRDHKIEEVHKEENDGEKFITSLSPEKTQFDIPYCPECQEKVVKSLDPFVPCTVCGFSETSLNMEALTTFTGITATTEESFFTQLVNTLIGKGELSLPTYNGIRHFSLLSTDENTNKGILICDPVDISEKFLITQGELDALMTVEKPTVRLKPKLKLRVEYELNDPFYPVFFADDKITLALSSALKNKGVEAVFCDHVTTLRVSSALEQQLIISVGRDLLPWHYEHSLKNDVFCEYEGYMAYGDTNGLLLDNKINVEGRSYISYVSNDSKNYQNKNTSVKNGIAFEPAHAALRSIVLEKELQGKALCGVHLSHKHTPHIFSFSSKIGYTPMVLFKDADLHNKKVLQPKEMIDAIASMDEGGARLIENFKKQFPDLYTKIEATTFKTDEDSSSLTRLWAMAAVFIGLYEGCDLIQGCDVLESTAIEFGGKSGPRIDYKVMSTDEGYQLDMRLAIRSAMSFKLAGLDDYLLSFGFIDSLADFIAQQAENSDANIGIKGVTLSGSFFENRQLFMRTHNSLSKNYPIYRNERLSMDDANIAIGAVTLGSE